MNKAFLAALAVLAMTLSACAYSKIKYSPSELDSFPPRVQQHIKNSEVAAGMTPIAVRYSWGAPDAVTVLPVNSEGQLREEWVYKRMLLYETRLTFTDGKLTDIASGMAKTDLNFLKKPEKKTEPKTEDAPPQQEQN